MIRFMQLPISFTNAVVRSILHKNNPHLVNEWSNLSYNDNHILIFFIFKVVYEHYILNIIY